MQFARCCTSVGYEAWPHFPANSGLPEMPSAEADSLCDPRDLPVLLGTCANTGLCGDCAARSGPMDGRLGPTPHAESIAPCSAFTRYNPDRTPAPADARFRSWLNSGTGAGAHQWPRDDAVSVAESSQSARAAQRPESPSTRRDTAVAGAQAAAQAAAPGSAGKMSWRSR